jgi:hypothetical protein
VLYWECKRRLRALEEFRSLVVRYFDTVAYVAGHGDRIQQTEESRKVRRKINDLMQDVGFSCNLIGQPLTVQYVPSPLVGGFQGNLSLLSNLFELREYHIPNSKVIDGLERVIGTYRRKTNYLYWQMFNPLFWLRVLLVKIVEVPFQILSAAGFDTAKFENSFMGKVVKAVVGFVAFAAALLTVLQILGLLDAAKKFVHTIWSIR